MGKTVHTDAEAGSSQIKLASLKDGVLTLFESTSRKGFQVFYQQEAKASSAGVCINRFFTRLYLEAVADMGTFVMELDYDMQCQ
eukprot:314518-Amphidinium_carterae.1